jgi:hypothetical protein
MSTNLKEVLQQKLDEHFKSFVRIDSNEHEIRVMLSGEDIPEIIDVQYNPDIDRIIIKFLEEDNADREEIADIITIYKRKSDKTLAAIEIKEFKSLLQSKIQPQLASRGTAIPKLGLRKRILEQKINDFLPSLLASSSRDYILQNLPS